MWRRGVSSFSLLSFLVYSKRAAGMEADSY